QRVIGDIERFQVHVEIVRELITRGDVYLQARIHERRLGTKRRVVLVLTELQQVFVTPVPGNAHLEAMLVVEGDQIRRVGETGDREAALRQVGPVIRLVRVDESRVRVEAKTRVAEHMLPGNLP